ncbi:hypothetical protein BJ138DRAFT_1085530 [Hygrophoropsis aurantiaca]|uniref:Uncharacterized protein n=1 Tax=Hygrophoropsis aurantiaca TaxID=72124 RepID=A0ACB8ADY9_9AGAM|nr:hypothetical protein BJ138DRAFT_1085530 [Hygrophoropsis aurantiaca]
MPEERNNHTELRTLYARLQSVQKSIAKYEPVLSKPPIIDASIECDEQGAGIGRVAESIPGLRFLREEIKRDLEVMEEFLERSHTSATPSLSTNAPYLMAVWNELLSAETPIALYRTFFPKNEKPSNTRRTANGSRYSGAKVDIVARGGQQWIRVNTVKNSRLLAEFREFDSYLTSSDDSTDEVQEKGLSPVHNELDNSVLRMGRALLAAANANPSPVSAVSPQVVMCLTRLDISPFDAEGEENDPRIAETVSSLRKVGIEVRLGDRKDAPIHSAATHTPTISLEPTCRINLDLSSLIALVSDITHSPLPTTAEEARMRFIPPQRYLEWKRERIKLLGSQGEVNPVSPGGTGATKEDTGKYSRALSNQALQEMKKGLLQDLHDRLSVQYPALEGVEFWTTPEARQRCLQIVSKIGGPKEKRRADALLSSGASSQVPPRCPEDQYWEHSRHPRNFLPLLPIRLFSLVETASGLSQDSSQSMNPQSFFESLASACRNILSHERSDRPDFRSEATSPDNVHGDIPPATVTNINSKLTVHTVRSMLRGATTGWTTLTANRSSVKALLQEVKATHRNHDVDREVQRESAAIWIVDPRSLAEGMRSDSDG